MKDEDTLDGPEQRAVHGLLSDLYRPPAPAVEPNERRHPFALRVAAALLFMGAGLLAGALFDARLPEAAAVLERARGGAAEVVDRRYRAELVALKTQGPERLGTGTLYARGAEAYAIRFDTPIAKGWTGSDGKETWFRADGGALSRWTSGQEAAWKEGDKLPFVRFDAFLLSSRERYDVVTLGRENGLLRVRATRKIDLPGVNISQFEVWVDEGSGVMMKMRYRMDPELWHWEPWVVTLEHESDAPLPSAFYAAEHAR